MTIVLSGKDELCPIPEATFWWLIWHMGIGLFLNPLCCITKLQRKKAIVHILIMTLQVFG